MATLVPEVILVAIATSVWVGLDLRLRDWSGSSFVSKPWRWVIGCLVFWIVVFPLYLVRRGQIRATGEERPIMPTSGVAKPEPGAERLAAIEIAWSLVQVLHGPGLAGDPDEPVRRSES